MLQKKLDSEAGFGIIHVSATLLIASVAIAGLFVTSFYVRQKAQENYHTRVALLKASEALEKIKLHNRSEQGPVDVTHIPFLAGDFVMDDRDGNPLVATIQNPRVSYGQLDILVAPFCVYDKVTIEVTWTEGPRFAFGTGSEDNTERSVVLREDYFRKHTGGGE